MRPLQDCALLHGGKELALLVFELCVYLYDSTVLHGSETIEMPTAACCTSCSPPHSSMPTGVPDAALGEPQGGVSREGAAAEEEEEEGGGDGEGEGGGEGAAVLELRAAGGSGRAGWFVQVLRALPDCAVLHDGKWKTLACVRVC